MAFTVRDLKKVLNKERTVEIASPVYYYYGKAKNINKKVLDLKVTYIAVGTADSNYEDRECVLVDAE